MNWIKNPGGKRYTARCAGREYMLVRVNTAAGALPWKATVEIGGVTRVIAKSHYMKDAKRAAEDWVPA